LRPTACRDSPSPPAPPVGEVGGPAPLDALPPRTGQVDGRAARRWRGLRNPAYQGPIGAVLVDGTPPARPWLTLAAVALLLTGYIVEKSLSGVTDDPYLVFATNAFALLGLRPLYFLLNSLLRRLVHLSYGLGAILGLIGVKLVLHWAHGIWPGLPEIPTVLSLVAILATVTVTSLVVTKKALRKEQIGPLAPCQ
jgi:hypothetical protein